MKWTNKSIIGLAISAFILTGLLAVTSVNTFGQEREEKPNTKLAKQAKITRNAAYCFIHLIFATVKARLLKCRLTRKPENS